MSNLGIDNDSNSREYKDKDKRHDAVCDSLTLVVVEKMDRRLLKSSSLQLRDLEIYVSYRTREVFADDISYSRPGRESNVCCVLVQVYSLSSQRHLQTLPFLQSYYDRQENHDTTDDDLTNEPVDAMVVFTQTRLCLNLEHVWLLKESSSVNYI